MKYIRTPTKCISFINLLSQEAQIVPDIRKHVSNHRPDQSLASDAPEKSMMSKCNSKQLNLNIQHSKT